MTLLAMSMRSFCLASASIWFMFFSAGGGVSVVSIIECYWICIQGSGNRRGEGKRGMRGGGILTILE